MRRLAISTVLALLATFGCGGGGGGGSNAQAPAPTATPVASPSPGGSVNLVLTLRATGEVAAASFSVGYEAGRGSFSGSGGNVRCRLGSGDTLAVNDDDTGTLRVAVVPADPSQAPALALPTTLTCPFDPSGAPITAADLRVGNQKIGVLDGTGIVVAGDPSRLDVR